MQVDTTKPIHPDTTIAHLLAQFFWAMHEVVAPDRQHFALASLKRREMERDAAAEATIQNKYPDAWYRRDELRRRAADHSVSFTPSATYAHQAAILDFLDAPSKATPLTWMHMTWCYAVDDDGAPTNSCLHPVNHAMYVWNSRDIAKQRPTGGTSNDSSVQELKAMFPLERCAWTADQWRTFETRHDVKPAATYAPPLTIRPDGATSLPRSDIPLRI